MVVLNDLDRFHLVSDVIDRVPGLASRAAYAKQWLRDKLIDHKLYIREHGQDMPEVSEWRWSPAAPANVRGNGRGDRRGGNGVAKMGRKPRRSVAP